MGGGWGRCDNVGPLGRWVLSRAGAQMYMWDISELQTRTVSIDAPENLCTCSLLALDCNISFVVSDSTVRACWTRDMKELDLCKIKDSFPGFSRYFPKKKTQTFCPFGFSHHFSWAFLSLRHPGSFRALGWRGFGVDEFLCDFPSWHPFDQLQGEDGGMGRWL